MKKISWLFLSLMLVSACVTCFGQMEISIKLKNTPCDSIVIQAFKDKKFSTIYAQPFSETVVFKSKTPLEPGMYNILADSNIQDVFIISSPKNQKFSILIDTNQNIYQGSPENTKYHDFLLKIVEFNQQRAALDKEYQDAQKSMPQYMLGVLADSLTARAKRIAAEREKFQRQQIAENPNSLYAAIVSTTIDIPEIPMEYYNDRYKIQKHIISHYFDNFPWKEPAIFNIPIGVDKIKEYCSMIYQIDNPDFDTLVVDALKAASVNETSLYAFYDQVEKVLGSNISPYKVEHTYIAMLKYMLTYKNLAPARKARYERELKFIDKNLDGSIAPDFRVVTNHGDTISLHSIKSDYMILYLQHPTCPTCRAARGKMATYEHLNKAINNGKLKVLTVYFENDPQVWDDFIHSSEANPRYMHGWNFDQTIADQELYETRTIPYMFLLDKDKKIIKKDILINEIEDYIQRLGIDR